MRDQIAYTASSFSLIAKFVHKVFPLVNTELSMWQRHAARGCPELAEQALASIRDKKFHCQGGSIYSLYEGVNTPNFVRLVVALQTISDYLDNLCDRAGIADERAFRQLHLAMNDALDPDAAPRNYYQYYPFSDDGGYLKELVHTCQEETAKLPAYAMVKPEVLRLSGLYSELQTYKHLDLTIRESKMLDWIGKHLPDYPDINPWEFAAATGSTLGMFMLCAAAANPGLTTTEAAAVSVAYFPWISGFHILLDYFIDSAEDRENGDLNFVSYYANEQQTLERLSHFSKQAMLQAKNIANPLFGQNVISGLLALYLSDPKANNPREKAVKDALLKSAGIYTNLIYRLCKLLRMKKSI